MAHSPAGPDPDRDGWLRARAALGRPDRGDPAGGRGLVPAGREALARRRANHGHDAHRHSGTARREDRRLDGKGQRRTIPGPIKGSKRRTLMSKVWFITGAGSGIGAGTARAALQAGDRVVATGRNLDKVRNAYQDVASENIALVPFDASQEAQ